MSASYAFIDTRARADPRIMFNDERTRNDRRPKGGAVGMWCHLSFDKGEAAFHGPFAREGSTLPGNRESRPTRAVCVHQPRYPST